MVFQEWGRGPDSLSSLQFLPMMHSIPSMRLCCSPSFKSGYRSHIMCRQLVFNLILHTITFIDLLWGRKRRHVGGNKKQIFPLSGLAEVSFICIPKFIFKGTFMDLGHMTPGWATRWKWRFSGWFDWCTAVSVPCFDRWVFCFSQQQHNGEN